MVLGFRRYLGIQGFGVLGDTVVTVPRQWPRAYASTSAEVSAACPLPSFAAQA